MIGLLETLVEVIENFPQYVLWAIETVSNLFFEVIQKVFEVATALIPLPEEPAVPEYIGNINWFFPIGAIVSIMVPIVTGYIAFLAIRWIYKKAGSL